MSVRRKDLSPVLALCLPLTVCMGSSGGQAVEQEKSRQEPTSVQQAGPSQGTPADIMDQIPEGDVLPDMPESATNAPDSYDGDANPATRAAGPDYFIGPEDVLDIDVFNVPELRRVVRVSNRGMIGLALIGPVKVAGLTVDQLRNQLEVLYGESYLQDPQVSVFVTEFRARSVSVIGAVERPGLYQLTAPRNLIEVLSMAGGLAKKSSAPAGRTLIVTRESGFGALPIVDGMRLMGDNKLEIEIRKLLYSQEADLNIMIQPLDTISVTKADLIYVVGDVGKPTGILMEDRDDLTVLQALAMAEGVNRTASKKKVRIFRRNEDGNKIEIPVNLSEILKGKVPDLPLVANDVLFVPDSTGKVMLQKGFEATISTISGLIIWRRP